MGTKRQQQQQHQNNETNVIFQTVGVIQLERGSPSFTRVIPCRQNDAIFCLHDNGVVSLRVRSPVVREASPASSGSASEEGSASTAPIGKDDAAAEMAYDTLCLSGGYLHFRYY